MTHRLRAAGIIIKDNQVLLMHRRREGREYWIIPGGGVEEGESREQTLKREIKEEVGMTVTICRPVFETDESLSHTIFFLCEVKDDQPQLGGPELQRHSPDNWYQPEWIPLDTVKSLPLYPAKAKDYILTL